MVTTRAYPVEVLGPITVLYNEAKEQGGLSRAKQRLLAHLTFARQQGVDARGFRSDEPRSDEDPARAAFRMAVSRLRAHLPAGVIEDVGEGVVRLMLDDADVDLWHLFALAGGERPLADVPIRQLVHLLDPSIRLDPVVLEIDPLDAEAPRRQVVEAQRELLLRLAAEQPQRLRGQMIEFLRRYIDEDPYNESLVSTLAVVLAQTGRRRDALRVLSEAREEFIDVGLGLSPRIDELELRLLDPSDDEGEGVAVTSTVIDPEPALPAALAELAAKPFVGDKGPIETLAAMLPAGTGVAVIVGPSAMGKTRLCAELARTAAVRGIATVYLRPRRSDSAFGPMVAALPSFREAIGGLRSPEGGPDPEELRSLLLARAIDALDERAGEGPLVVVVDDAHQLDSGTSRLLQMLPDSDLAGRLLLVVVATREQAQEPLTPPVADLMDRSGTIVIEPTLLDDDDLGDLVRLVRGHQLEHAVFNEARQLGELSGRRAGVAALLLDATGEASLRPDPGSLRGLRPLVEVAHTMSSSARTMGAAAAVVGLEFNVTTVAAVTGSEAEDVIAGLDELVRANFVHDLGDTDFEFAHALIAAALLEMTPVGQQAEWHEAAAVHLADDVHRRAHHEFSAVSRLPLPQVLASLRASADVHLLTGAYWEATHTYRNMVMLQGGEVDPKVAAGYARALELAGFPNGASRVRETALTAAFGRNDHEQALAITVSGLPEGEILEGDETLLERLQAIHFSALDREAAHRLACHRSRQLAIVGAQAEAAEHAERALELAESPSEFVGGTLAKRFVISCTSPPSERLDLLNDIEEQVVQVDTATMAEYVCLQTLDCYEAGLADEAVTWRRRLDDIEDAPVLRRWHGMLFDTMVARDAGRFAEAAERRTEARAYGVARGINAAQQAHDAAAVNDIWMMGDLADLADHVAPGALLDPSISLIHRAGGAAALLAAGRNVEAAELAEEVARAALRSPLGQKSSALAIAAEALAHSAQHDLIADAHDLLAKRGTSSMVFGACVSSLGPVARYLAALTPPGDESARDAYLAQAVELAEEAGWPAWAVCNRYHRAAVINDQGEIEELRRDLEGSELAMLIAD